MSGDNRDIFSEKFPTPEELKKLSTRELEKVAAKVRKVIVEAVELNGGHLASNLGVVELTIALHSVFDFTKDRLLFDVSHQCYPHKILTGRAAGFAHLRNPGGVAGFSAPQESPYDVFAVGHAGTAVSTAAGLSVAAKRRNENRHIVAVVGDAAMQNGMSLEAMNHAGSIKAPLLVILNDNEMGISPTVGAISGQISRVRIDRRYLQIKDEVRAFIDRLPVLGQVFERLGRGFLDAVGRAISPGAIFELMGFAYYGPTDGHDIDVLRRQLESVKDMPGPVLLHVVTKKGCGEQCAEDDPTKFHSAHASRSQEKIAPVLGFPHGPPPAEVGVKDSIDYLDGVSSYSDAFGRIVNRLIAERPEVVAVTAAMMEGTGLSALRKGHQQNLFDVGIAEGHAVGFAAGLAAGGMKPIVAIYSTFMQRAFDQVFEELYLQDGLGVVIAMDRAGVVGGDGASHQGAYDVAFLSALPGVVQMAPRDALMLEAMLRLGLELKAPSAIRYPKDVPPAPFPGVGKLELGKAEVLHKGRDIALLAYGAAVGWTLDALNRLHAKGFEPTVVDLRFANPLDLAMLKEIAPRHKLVVTVEDGIIENGVGRRIGAILAEAGLLTEMRIVNLGVPDARLPHAERAALLTALGLTGDGIADRIIKEWS